MDHEACLLNHRRLLCSSAMKRKWLRDRTRRDQGGLDFVMAHIQVRVSSPSLLTVYGTSRLRSCSAASCAALVLSYAKGKGRAETWSHDVTRMSDAVRPAASDARDIWEVAPSAHQAILEFSSVPFPGLY